VLSLYKLIQISTTVCSVLEMGNRLAKTHPCPNPPKSKSSILQEAIEFIEKGGTIGQPTCAEIISDIDKMDRIIPLLKPNPR
jgi:hypothetical protein